MKNVCLVIIDGYGVSEETEGNAALNSHFIDSLKESKEHLEIFAHGEYVGLPPGKMGSSEVGHMTLGSGRVIKQSLEVVKDAYESGELAKILGRRVMSENVHLIGMISDGGVHSHINHLRYLIDCLEKRHKVFVHAFADGIDVPPKTFAKFAEQFGNIVSVSGRHYAMDRDKNFERTDKVFKMMTEGSNSRYCDDIVAGIRSAVESSQSDEFIEPVLLKENPISPNDTVVFFNFRADRMRQIYSRIKAYCRTYTLTEYEDGDKCAIIKKPVVSNTLSEWLAKHGKTQAHIAETEKYAHVTYFLNGGRECKYDGEEWFLLPSPKVKKFDLEPGTSMTEVADKCRECVERGYHFVVLNFAAPDLVGHTGNYEKAVEAVKLMDEQVKRVYEKCLEHGYALVVTADHGNVEQMVQDGQPCKSHTTNKVLFLVLNADKRVVQKPDASLSDVAPTVLTLMDVPVPEEMTGRPLVE